MRDRPFLPSAHRDDATVRRAATASTASIQDMRVDHGRANVLVAQEFLHGADVVAIGQKMRGD